MVEFYIKKDVEESTIMNTDTSLKISKEIQKKFFNETNKWYTELCLEYQVLESDIAVWNGIGDDNRNQFMVSLAEAFFLSQAFFSLSKAKDDIFWIKYEIMEKKLNNKISGVTVEKIKAVKPAVVRTPGGYATITKYRGEI